VFCTFAAVGISGVQTNKISATFQGWVAVENGQALSLIVGIIVAVLIALIILGGIKSIGRVASVIAPFMSVLFIGMSLVVIFSNIAAVGNAFALIFANIFKFEAGVAGVVGYAFSQIIQKGLARGVFSNEAGLGSSVIAQSASEEKEPVKQGLWGLFGVFLVTFVICTMTALVVLVSFGNETGMKEVLYASGAVDTVVAMKAFENTLGVFGTTVYAIVLPLFAFTTILAWAYYGEKAVEYLFRKTGEKGRKIATVVFKLLYISLIVLSALIDGELAWAIADTFNGLMALPNLVGVILLSGLVVKITKNYFDRKKGIAVKPMLSAYENLEEEFILELEKGNVENE
jgi:AGCS family alanine or glycine:cation symporter